MDSGLLFAPADNIRLGPGSLLLRGFALPQEDELLAGLSAVTAHAPFRHMVTPGGFPMSVGMTNCGALGWVTDRRGYRYEPVDPLSGQPWPAMPTIFAHLASSAAEHAGYAGFESDACLINRYAVGAKMSLHQDKDEADLHQPIVSLSLGISAVFQFGGLARTDSVERIRLEHGDVVVWGGPDRLRYHGILPLKSEQHATLKSYRVNLTFRKAG